MPQFPLQWVAAVFELPKKLPQFRVIHRTFCLVSYQILLADIGDIARLAVLSEQMVERLVLRGADVFGDGVIPFLAIRKDWIDIEDHPAKRKDAVADDVPNAEPCVRYRRGIRTEAVVV